MGWIAKAVAALGVGAAFMAAPAGAAQGGTADFNAQGPSSDALYVAQWAMETADHGEMPFVVVDKKRAWVYVFESGGRLTGATPALLGQAIGDDSSPTVGEHTQAGEVPMHERTTPAGRFISQPGRNLKGEHVVWVDYAAAFAIHRLRPGASLRSREASLASDTPSDNRASLGCVVVPAAFYENVVLPLLGRNRAVVYVLPEKRQVRQMFGSL